jgi:16S rRNA (adenine1518-N6/adenine1519-N6)-dimethyltransferase
MKMETGENRKDAGRKGAGSAGGTDAAAGNGAAIATPHRTLDIVRRHGFVFRKSLGQHFLTDSRVLDRIVEASGLDKSRGALEIGPGIGALTERLAQSAGRVVAIEIDGRLIPILEEVLAPYPNVHVLHEDALKVDLPGLWQARFRDLAGVSVAANLPYYAAAPIVMTLLESRLPWERLVLMVQKEIADRITAAPGGKEYGSLSVAVQYFCETEHICRVPPGAFVPSPKVDSSVVRLTPRREGRVRVADEKLFFRVVHAAFEQRRKTIANNIARLLGQEGKAEAVGILSGCGIDPGRRGETLSLEEFAALTEALAASGKVTHSGSDSPIG